MARDYESDAEVARLLERYRKGHMVAFKRDLVLPLGSEDTARFLHHALHWYRKCDYSPFYKFREPCDHIAYREGDSWTEELFFNREQFRIARDRVATKISKGDSKNAVFDVTTATFGENGVMDNSRNLMVYWRDGSGMTWYDFNWALLMDLFSKVYPKKDDDTESSKTPALEQSRRCSTAPETTHLNTVVTTEVTHNDSSAVAVCPGRKDGVPLTDWFSSVWREGQHKDRAQALGVVYRFLFGTEPNYGRLFKMAKELNSGKLLFDLMLDAAKVQLSDDPQTFLQGMVNNRQNKRGASTETISSSAPSQHDILFGKS